MENTLIKLTLHDETKKRAHDSQIVRAKENLKVSHGGSSYRYKTELLLFSRRVNLQDHPTLLVNDVPIQEVVAHKHLGVYLSQRCDWQKHIDLIKEKAWSRINLLRMLKIQ